MPREMLPVTLWRDSLCFWMRMAQANAEFGLRMWQVFGFPPPPSLDSDVLKVCADASKPADVSDPAPRRTAPAPANPSSATATPPRPANGRRKPVASRTAPSSVPV